MLPDPLPSAREDSDYRPPATDVAVAVGVRVGVTVTVASRGVAVGATRSSAATQPTRFETS